MDYVKLLFIGLTVPAFSLLFPGIKMAIKPQVIDFKEALLTIIEHVTNLIVGEDYETNYDSN